MQYESSFRGLTTGEEDSRVCEEAEETDGGGGEGMDRVKKPANKQAWERVPV